ncbi:uncharacterized protein LOC144624941 [Crassostrea virginica]
MGLSGIILFIAVLAISGTVSGNSNVTAKPPSGNCVVINMMEKDIKPKMASLERRLGNMENSLNLQNNNTKTKVTGLERKIHAMQNTINLQKKQIKALQKRKDFKCESGILGYYKYPKPTWPYRQRVKFQSPFKHPPKVTYGLYFLDSSKSTNLRINTTVNNIKKNGFHVQIKTWAGTELFGAYISWMACGY